MGQQDHGLQTVLIQTCQLILTNKMKYIYIEQECVLWGMTRVIIPSRGRERVLELLHESHPGIVKMKYIARRVCWWPKLDSEIESYAHNCGNCQVTTAVSTTSICTSMGMARKALGENRC